MSPPTQGQHMRDAASDNDGPPPSSSSQTNIVDVLESAPPPLHSIVVLGALTAALVACFPSLEELDLVATVQAFTSPVFPSLLSVQALGWIRLGIGIFMSGTILYDVIFNEINLTTSYLPQTKLKHAKVHLKGIMTQTTFTKWAWAILTLSFLWNGVVTLILQHHHANNHNKHIIDDDDTAVSTWFLFRIPTVLFCTAAPTALLTSTIVRYAIWPQMLNNPEASTAPLKKPIGIIHHNFNIILALCEVALLGGFPIHMSCLAIAPMYGIAYQLFAWSITHKWAAKEYGPQFPYFFMDTTMGYLPSITIVIILALFMIYYGIFCALGYVLHQWLEERGILWNIGFVVVISSVSCRFQD